MACPTFAIQARDGTRLLVGCHPAEGNEPVALLIHGIASHMGWYDRLGAELARGGITTYLPDRRGVGLSEGKRGHALLWRTLVEDVLLVAEEIHRRHPGRPLHSIGFSLGSPISLGASLVASDLFQSQILVSPGLATSLRVSWKTKLRMLRHAFVEPERLQDLPFTVHQLTDHEAWRELLEADPLRTRQVTARFILEVLRLQRFVRRQLHRVRSPLLCLLAGGDAIIDNQVVTTLLSRAGSLRVRIHVFEGAGHFLAASVPRAEIARHIHAWIREPAPTGREELTIASVNPYPLEALDRPWSAPADADPGSPA